MTDIALIYIDGQFDFQLSDNDFMKDEGLETAIIISLFTDRRVRPEELPVEETDRRGYWADAINDDGDLIGSKLWLLKREKITSEVLVKARQYCEEALQWLVDDNIADRVDVITERTDLNQISIEIDIIKPHDGSVSRKYAFIWDNVNGVSTSITA